MRNLTVSNEENGREIFCCFTGYRPSKFPFPLNKKMSEFESLQNKLIDIIFSLPKDACVTFYSGMAMGFDIIAAESVLLLKRAGRDVRLVCVLPFEGQGDGFSEPWHSRYNKIIETADETVVMSKEYYKGCYFKRNAFLVDNSDYVITWYDGKPGGTASTLKYAEKKGRRIINLYDGRISSICKEIQTAIGF